MMWRGFVAIFGDACQKIGFKNFESDFFGGRFSDGLRPMKHKAGIDAGVFGVQPELRRFCARCQF